MLLNLLSYLLLLWPGVPDPHQNLFRILTATSEKTRQILCFLTIHPAVLLNSGPIEQRSY